MRVWHSAGFAIALPDLQYTMIGDAGMNWIINWINADTNWIVIGFKIGIGLALAFVAICVIFFVVMLICGIIATIFDIFFE